MGKDLKITSSGGISAAGGLSATGDTNYFVGNVGIGTASPAVGLDLRGDMRLDGSATDRSIYFRNQNTVAKVRSDAALQFDVGVSSSPSVAMYIAEDTRFVGIGTSSPAAKLAICGCTDNTSSCSLVVYNSGGTVITRIRDDGSAYISNDTTVMGNLSVHGDLIYIDTAVTVTSALSVLNSGTGPALFVSQEGLQPIAHFIDSNGDDIVFDDNGKIGIGTFTPTVQLDVYNSSGWGGIDIDGSSGGEIKLQKAGTTYLDMYASDSGSTGSTLKVNDHLQIATNNSTGAGTATYFKDDGTVGIGTLSPTEKLTIDGSLTASGDIRSSCGTVEGKLLYARNCVATSLMTAQYISNIGEACIQSGKSGCVRIGTSQGWAMTLSANPDNVARVGIGGALPGELRINCSW